MNDTQIQHAARCRRPAPTLRTSWRGHPELHCPACGRTAPATSTTKETR